MVRRRQIYEGKAKILYEGPEPGTLIQYFKDDATAFNAQKRGTISGKGVLNNRISEHIFTLLGQIGIKVILISQSKSLHFPLIQKAELDFYLLGWGVPTLDSHYVFTFLVFVLPNLFFTGAVFFTPPELRQQMSSCPKRSIVKSIVTLTSPGTSRSLFGSSTISRNSPVDCK